MNWKAAAKRHRRKAKLWRMKYDQVNGELTREQCRTPWWVDHSIQSFLVLCFGIAFLIVMGADIFDWIRKKIG